MASRKDELQAHQFLKQRATSALIVHETDPLRPLFRGATVGTYGSVALALVVLAVMGVIGLLKPHSGKKFTPGQKVIVEKETGSRFVFLDGRLHPVLNYSSALLALGTDADTQSVKRAALVNVPRGAPVGISGAPDELPDRRHLLAGAWSMCSQEGTDASGSRTVRSVLLVGQTPPGGVRGGDRAVLADVPATGLHYLVWHGYRHQITDEHAVSVGLALDDETRFLLSPTWIDTLPAGVAVGPLSVPNTGFRSDAVPSRPQTRIGTLFVVQLSAGVRQYYLAGQHRLTPITPLQYEIQLAAASTRAAYPGSLPHGIGLDPAEVTLAGQQSGSIAAADPPATRPAFVRTQAADPALCAVYRPGHGVPGLVAAPRMPAGRFAQTTAGVTASGTVLADRVVVPAGRAALVSLAADSGSRTGTVALVTDTGRRFTLPDQGVAASLGYGGVTPVRMPAGLAVRIPEGPVLDPTAARMPP